MHVYDAATGEEIENVLEARIILSAKHTPLVWLRVDDVQLDLVTTQQETPPYCDLSESARA